MKKKPKKHSPGETLEILLSTTDQDNFEDTMPTHLLDEWVREQGGSPEALWARLEPFIKEMLAKRAKT